MSPISSNLAGQAGRMPVGDPRRVAASIAMFERLCEHWSLRRDERETLLGGIPKSTWSEWRQRPALARLKSDTRERIANLFTIDLNAHSLFAPEFADRWIREPNRAFEGKSPLSRMLQGRVEDVIAVRRYVEQVRTSSSVDDVPARLPSLAEAAVSHLPGDALGAEDHVDDALAVLERAVAAYERLAAARADYQPNLIAAGRALEAMRNAMKPLQHGDGETKSSARGRHKSA